MARILRFPLLSHATSTATRVLVEGRSGALVSRGPGASLWFRPLDTTLSEVPIEDLEYTYLAQATTADHQAVSVQVALTIRIVDPVQAAKRIDFALDTRTGEWTGQPIRTLQNRISETARHFVVRTVAAATLERMLDDGLAIVQAELVEGLTGETELVAAGVVLSSVKVVAVRPEEDVERALTTTVRERIQAEADRATYERRAQAVDRERAIKENELHNKIELARREAQLVEIHGANERRRSEQEQERQQLALAGRVAEITQVAEAQNEATRRTLDAFADAELPALVATLAPEIVAHLPKVDSVTITPDLLSGALATAIRGLRA